MHTSELMRRGWPRDTGDLARLRGLQTRVATHGNSLITSLANSDASSQLGELEDGVLMKVAETAMPNVQWLYI